MDENYNCSWDYNVGFPQQTSVCENSSSVKSPSFLKNIYHEVIALKKND